MLIQVSTPTSAAELRALYRRTRAHFTAAQAAADAQTAASARSAAAAVPYAAAARSLAGRNPRHSRFSGATTVRVVARHFGLEPAALAGGARPRPLVVARWIVMRICIDVGGYTAARAAQLLNRDHSTALYGLRELAALMARDSALAGAVAYLMRQCEAAAAPASAGRGGA